MAIWYDLGNSDDEVSLYRQSGTTARRFSLIDGADDILDASRSKIWVKVTRDESGKLGTIQIRRRGKELRLGRHCARCRLLHPLPISAFAATIPVVIPRNFGWTISPYLIWRMPKMDSNF